MYALDGIFSVLQGVLLHCSLAYQRKLGL